MAQGLAGPSRSAVLTAVARALHQEEPAPHVLEDPYALTLSGPDGVVIRHQLLAELSHESLLAFSRWVCVRARYPEDLLERALISGVRQYVVLGAGLDSFAYRRPDLAGRVHVFEVDHPHTQGWKRQRLAEAGVEPVVDLTFASVDFERQTLQEGLDAAGFSFSEPAVFSWIGVTMYLTLDAIRETLATVACGAPGTSIVLTYNQPPEALTGLGSQTQSTLARIITEMGEPFVSLFRPDEFEALLRDVGYTDIQHFGPDEALTVYFAGRSDAQMAGAQRLISGTIGN